jgi:hypothetical protein
MKIHTDNSPNTDMKTQPLQYDMHLLPVYTTRARAIAAPTCLQELSGIAQIILPEIKQIIRKLQLNTSFH